MHTQFSDWSSVSGIDFDGIKSYELLTEVLSGKLDSEEEAEILTNFCRDYSSCTAAYAAIPIMVENDCPNLKTKWALLHTAGLAIIYSRNDVSPSKDLFASNFGQMFKDKIYHEMLPLALVAQLSFMHLILSLSVMAALKEDYALEEALFGLALRTSYT
jgi:hypothetical protein